MIHKFQQYFESIFQPKRVTQRADELSIKQGEILEKMQHIIDEYQKFIESLGCYKIKSFFFDHLMPCLAFESIGKIGKDSPYASRELGQKAKFIIYFEPQGTMILFENNGYTEDLHSLEDLQNLLPTTGYIIKANENTTYEADVNAEHVANGGIPNKILWCGDLIISLRKGKLEVWENDTYRQNIGAPLYQFTRADLETCKINYHSKIDDFYIQHMHVLTNRKLDLFDFHYNPKDHNKYFFLGEDGLDLLLNFLDENS